MHTLKARDLVKVFPDGTRALDGVSFEAERSQVLTLLGPSGCGKSTLLRIVAGLDRASAGHIELDGRSLDDLSPAEREVGFVFQNYALYPHLSVEGNLGLAMEVRRVPRGERQQRIRETADMLGIGHLLARRPGQLSGGQQQRVALGRALVRRPRLYLLDEPLSNLDALLREGMRAELKTLFRRVSATVLYVTHDQAEAMSLSDRVAVMQSGRILQCAPPLELYERPSSLFVATFVGSPRMTVWTGRKEGSQFVARGVRIPAPAGVPEGAQIAVGIRPEDVVVLTEQSAGALAATVDVTEALGSRMLLTLRSGDESARAMVAPQEWPERVWMSWPANRLHWFDGGTGTRIASLEAA